MKTLLKSGFLLATLLSGTAYALPALQLGPGAGDWTYNTTTETWETTDNPLTFVAYANAVDDNGGKGAYAWESPLAQYAYLVITAIPNQTDDTDVFDVTVSDDAGTLSMVDRGFGNPPVNDTNSLAGHSVFSSYYEVYEFIFDGSLVTIGDTQLGSTGTGIGYLESITVLINSLFAGVEGIHFDLFTVNGDGLWDPSNPNDRKLVFAFAPFSHDAEFVPEPTTLVLLLLGLIGFRFTRRRLNS